MCSTFNCVYTYILICISIHTKSYIYNVCEKYIKQAGKYNHGHFKADGTTHSIPTALALAFESLMLGRQSLGEENDFKFASTLLNDLIKIWNENLAQLRQQYSDHMKSTALAALEQNPDAQSEAVQKQVADQMQKVLQETLDEMKTVVIAQTTTAFKNLGTVTAAYFVLFHFCFLKAVYIYKYTYMHIHRYIYMQH